MRSSCSVHLNTNYSYWKLASISNINAFSVSITVVHSGEKNQVKQPQQSVLIILIQIQ